MNQSRLMSAVEAVANVLTGFLLAMLGQSLVYPALGLKVTLWQSLQIGIAFTGLSLVRSYALRRLFNRIRG